MSRMPKHWLVAPPAPRSFLAQKGRIHEVLAQILFNRGFETIVEAEQFLYARVLDDKLSNPFQMKGMQKAVSRIRSAIKRNEPIAVYGDFDADGVTSTTLMIQVLKALGARCMAYIPDRVEEGYGLNSPALHDLASQGIKLVITVDCGIRSVQEVADGKAAGLDMIITDHHSVGPEIPDADAVINPQQADCLYPEDKLAGVGVAFKLADALLRVSRQNGGRHNQVTLQAHDLLDLVAIGTVADLMPLNRIENRVLVRRGLQVLNAAKRPGVRALMAVSGVEPGKVTTASIGFGLGPRINAAGRLKSAMQAVELLSAPTMDEARPHADALQELNVERQNLTRDAQELIREQLDNESRDMPLIFAGSTEFLPGIVGLVAGRLTEEYYRPAVILEYGEDESRASCRSIPQFNITQALDECADLLVRHGGHAAAAGFTVLNGNVEALKEQLIAKARTVLKGQELLPTLEIDMELDASRLTENLAFSLFDLEPTGFENPPPLFVTRNLSVSEYRTVGNDDRHLKMRFSRSNMPPIDAIAFGFGEWAADMPDLLDVAYHLEINEWNGRRSVQMNVQDIKAAGTDV